MLCAMAIVGPTFPPFKMPPLEAALDPASRSVVARMRVISIAIWIIWTLAGTAMGSIYAIGVFSEPHEVPLSTWYKVALILVVICSGVVGCLVGYVHKIFIDWARQVLVVLGQVANK